MGKRIDCKTEVEHILNGDTVVCAKLYNELMAFLLKLNKSGNVDIATLKDIAQNSMIKFILNLRDNRFEYRSTLSTYLKAIARNEFYKYFERLKDLVPIEDTNIVEELADESIGQTDFEEVRWKVYNIEFSNLRKECRQLLRYAISKLSKEEISENLGYGDPEIVRERLYRCKLRLVMLMKNNELYNKFMNYDD